VSDTELGKQGSKARVGGCHLARSRRFKRGIRGGGYWRMVTHADVTGDDVEYALDVIGSTISEYGKK
jgi:hypothetical protein